MTNLTNFFKNDTEYKFFEGHCQQSEGETEYLKDIINNDNIINVMEIGFNAGHSAELFLSTNKKINLVSFDLGYHNYVKKGKEFIDKTYPGRHELILGNSLITVPDYFNKTNKKFDLIFIDGGHTYYIAKGDLINCKNLSHDKTIVIMDDTMNNEKWINKWNLGPNKAWSEAKDNNIIRHIEAIDFSNTHGLSWGYYN